MTREEFEAAYAERSGMTVAKLHELGLHGEPCDCGEDGCEGWQMDWEHRQPLPASVSLADVRRIVEGGDVILGPTL